MELTAQERLDRALDLAREARDSGEISDEMFARFEREVGVPQGTPVLINAEIHCQRGLNGSDPRVVQAVTAALNSALRQVNGSVVQGSVRVIIGGNQ